MYCLFLHVTLNNADIICKMHIHSPVDSILVWILREVIKMCFFSLKENEKLYYNRY